MKKFEYDDHGLASKELIEYLIKDRSLRDSYRAEVFAILMLEKIIEYGEAVEDVSKDQLVYFLTNLIPELTYEEAVLFFDDEKLTNIGISSKRSRLKALEVFTK